MEYSYSCLDVTLLLKLNNTQNVFTIREFLELSWLVFIMTTFYCTSWYNIIIDNCSTLWRIRLIIVEIIQLLIYQLYLKDKSHQHFATLIYWMFVCNYSLYISQYSPEVLFAWISLIFNIWLSFRKCLRNKRKVQGNKKLRKLIERTMIRKMKKILYKHRNETTHLIGRNIVLDQIYFIMCLLIWLVSLKWTF